VTRSTRGTRSRHKHIPKGGRLDCAFKKAGVAYVAHSEASTYASVDASKKRKAHALGKPMTKRAKSAPKKKTGTVKLIPSKERLSLKRTFDA
jgi:hypothetical protein